MVLAISSESLKGQSFKERHYSLACIITELTLAVGSHILSMFCNSLACPVRTLFLTASCSPDTYNFIYLQPDCFLVLEIEVVLSLTWSFLNQTRASQ